MPVGAPSVAERIRFISRRWTFSKVPIGLPLPQGLLERAIPIVLLAAIRLAVVLPQEICGLPNRLFEFRISEYLAAIALNAHGFSPSL